MVISAEKASMPPLDREPSPAASSRRGSQSQLHNFSFPILKKWGSQRVLRCLSVNRDGEIISGGQRSTPVGRSHLSGPRILAPDQEAEGGGDKRGFEEARAKLLVPPKPEKLPEPKPVPAPAPKPSSSTVGPWNLKKRRRKRVSSEASILIERRESLSLPAERSSRTRAVRLRSADGERKERPRFSITLSREEIAEDIYAVTGSLPQRRPRKRAQVIQKQLDSLYPGSWLSEITADSYKVPD